MFSLGRDQFSDTFFTLCHLCYVQTDVRDSMMIGC